MRRLAESLDPAQLAALRTSFLRVMGGLLVLCATTDVIFFRDLPLASLGTLVAAQAGVFAPLVPLGLHYLPLVRDPRGALHRRWVLPNVLTAFRIFAIPSIAVGLQHVDDPRARTGVTVLFAVALVSDLLDGVISRRFRRESDLGRALDPFADTCFHVAVSAALFAAKLLPMWFLAVAFVRFLPSFVFGFWLFLRGGALEIGPTMLGKLSSAGMGIAILSFVLLAVGVPVPGQVLQIVTVVVSILCAASALQYGRIGVARLRSGALR